MNVLQGSNAQFQPPEDGDGVGGAGMVEYGGSEIKSGAEHLLGLGVAHTERINTHLMSITVREVN